MNVGDFISSWVRDLVLLFIIITLVDLVMPKGTMRRYINFVVGLLIIFTVINPFINLTSLDFQLDREVFRNIDNQFEYDEEVFNQQEDQIEFLYKEKISEEIKTYIEGNTDYKIVALDLEINKEDDNFGAISHLSILIDDGDMEDIESNIEINIKPVVFENYTRIEEKNNEYLDIKEEISNRYEIDKDLINISTRKLED